MDEIRIPGSDALRDIADLVDQVHRLRLAITGTSAQQGLLAQVESARPVVDQLSASLDELREQNGSAIELAQLLEANSREMLVAIPDRLLGTLRSQLFEETLRKVLADGAVEIGHEIAVARLELAASQIAPEAGESAKRIVDAVLAKHNADSVVALDHRIADLDAQHELEIKRLIGQHQIALERAEAALDEAQKSCERVAKMRDQAEGRLQHERRMQGRNSLQWGVVAFVTGVGLTLFLNQPALAALGNFVKTL